MRSGACGAGLLEVLVALLVFAVGLSGLLAMQLAAKRAIFESSQRSLAIALARDMVERIRSNPGQLASYSLSGLGDEALALPPGDCEASGCSPAARVGADIRAWHVQITGAAETRLAGHVAVNTGGLVNPRACITGGGGQVKVAIAWRGSSALATPGEESGIRGSGCGLGLGLYGEGDRFRRLLVLNAYVGAG